MALQSGLWGPGPGVAGKGWAAAALAVLLSACLGVATKVQAEVPSGLDAFVAGAMKEYNVPGVSVAIVEGDKVTVRGYGVRSVARPNAVDADTVFMLASNTKPFTAALCGIMVDEGKIDWDGHVMDKWPVFALNDMYASKMCTLRDLLAHRSGLPKFAGDNFEPMGFTRDDIIARLKYFKPACSFREKDGYSNPGIMAAGMVAATVGGGTYESLMQQRIFNPLGMTRTAIAVRDASLIENSADAHVPLPGGVGSKVVPWDNPPQLAPAGAMSSSGKDMAQWIRLHLNEGRVDGKQIISAKTIKEMHAPSMVAELSFGEMAPIDEASGFSYGLGWGTYYYQGHQIVEKGGARLGIRTVVTMAPDKKVGFAVLANQNLTPLPEAVRAYLLDTMVAKSDYDMQEKIRVSNANIQKMFASPPPPTNVHPMSMPLEKYAGDYQGDLYGVIKIVYQNGKLHWQGGPSNVTGSFEPIGYNTFLLGWPEGRISLPEEVTFTVDGEGRPTVLETDNFGTLTRVEKTKS